MSLALTIFFSVLLITAVTFTRQRLVVELSAASLLLFRSSRPGLQLYTLFSLPGTIVHELSHWLMAELLGIRTGEIKVFPDWESLGSQSARALGFVATTRPDPLRGFLIGSAPFLSGTALLLLFSHLLQQIWMTGSWWQFALIFYAIFTIGNNFLLSNSDRRFWLPVAIFIVMFGAILSSFHFSFSFFPFYPFTNLLVKLNYGLGLTILLNLAMIVGSLGVRLILQAITGKQLKIKRRSR